mmetsp:Transcript_8318/g.19151  ORF Transcript_8318/g.19151 Transcript_8318/m.19151 type:complete len:666 (-) Transcript_8318:10-2007(-)
MQLALFEPPDFCRGIPDLTDSLGGVTSSYFQRGEHLGSGSFGSVYKCLDSTTGALFAVKEVPLAGRDCTQSRVQALLREVQVLSRLEHPNVIRYYGAESTAQVLCIFVEFVSGGSLASYVERFGPLKERVVRLYLRQLLGGLHYLHAEGVVHRDIKPANVLVDANGTCKLADFGCAEMLSEIASDAPKVTGTPNFMAPEVAQRAGHGREADIWSLGCTVLEVCTGLAPWSHISQPETTLFLLKRGGIPEIPDTLSSEAQLFIKSCLVVDASNRLTVAKLLEHPFASPAPTTPRRKRPASMLPSPSPAARSPMQRPRSRLLPGVLNSSDAPSPVHTTPASSRSHAVMDAALKLLCAVPRDRSAVDSGAPARDRLGRAVASPSLGLASPMKRPRRGLTTLGLQLGHESPTSLAPASLRLPSPPLSPLRLSLSLSPSTTCSASVEGSPTLSASSPDLPPVASPLSLDTPNSADWRMLALGLARGVGGDVGGALSLTRSFQGLSTSPPSSQSQSRASPGAAPEDPTDHWAPCSLGDVWTSLTSMCEWRSSWSHWTGGMSAGAIVAVWQRRGRWSRPYYSAASVSARAQRRQAWAQSPPQESAPQATASTASTTATTSSSTPLGAASAAMGAAMSRRAAAAAASCPIINQLSVRVAAAVARNKKFRLRAR